MRWLLRPPMFGISAVKELVFVALTAIRAINKNHFSAAISDCRNSRVQESIDRYETVPGCRLQ